MAFVLAIAMLIAVGVASMSTAGATAEGSLYAWGYNEDGELGDGTTTDSFTPLEVASVGGFTAVAAGGGHTLALKSDGTVWSWGYNSNGELGDGTTTGSSTPVEVSSLGDVTNVAAGAFHSLALTSDGHVSAWGNNPHGELGDGTTTSRHTPGPVASLHGVTAVAAGWDHNLALTSNGTVWAWGSNEAGQLGDGTTTDQAIPVQVPSLADVTALAAGASHSLALKSDGTVWAWGANRWGQLGDGSFTEAFGPVRVSSLGDVTAVAAGVGSSHSLALKSDGTVWAWGGNWHGQLGDGGTTDSSTPVQVSSLGGVSALAAGDLHSLAVKSDGTAWAWGHNGSGQLGNGTTTHSPIPVQVSSLTGVTAVEAGSAHSLALRGPAAAITPATLDFGDWSVSDTSGAQTVTIINTGGGTLRVPSMNFAGTDPGDFAISANSCGAGVSNGGTCDVGVVFKPTAAGPRNATLQIADNASGSPHSVSLSGNGLPTPVALNPGSLSFGDQRVATTSGPQTITLANTGSGTLQVASITVGGANPGDFAISTNSCGPDLTAGATCSMGVVFKPTVPGPRNATLEVADNAPGSPHSVSLSGNGVAAPAAVLSPSAVNFGDQGVGTTSGTQSISLANTGSGTLLVASTALVGTNAGDFAMSGSSCGASVAPGASCSIGVVFKPTAAGPRNATLQIVDDAPGSPHTVALAGHGTLADLGVALAASPDTVRSGQQLTYTITVSNFGPTRGTGVVLTDALPPETRFVSATTSSGTCTTPPVGSTGMVTCNLGSIENGANTSSKIVVKVVAQRRSTVTNKVSVSSTSTDPNTANNSVSISNPVK